MSDEIDAFKKNKNIIDNSYTSDVLNHNSSVTPALTSDTFLGTPPGYFVGQINYTTIINPDKTSQTGQTDAIVVVPSSPTPLATIPISAAPS